MSEKILIATLGDHPAVVTGMVKALREFEAIKIDTVYVLHPTDTGKAIAEFGSLLVKEHLEREERCFVVSYPLGFGDANTKQHSLSFLHTLSHVLGKYNNPDSFQVYLSLAGGRKNTSALMALVTQFFPAVRGLYHLLDRREGRGPGFPTIEQLVLMSHEEQLRTLDPPLDYLNLVPIPYPGAFANANTLWHALQTGKSIGYPPEVESFFGTVAGRQPGEALLKVQVTEQAIQDYRALGPEFKNKLIGYARRMRDPNHLKAKASGPRGWDTNCEVYPEHRAHSNLRLFYYWDQEAQTVTIHRAMLHQEYDRKGCLWYQESTNVEPFSALERECVLLVPLGKTPMVATQTYTLLHQSAEEGEPNVPTVAVLYPQGSALIRKGVRMLREQFRRRDVEFINYPIKDLRDVDSEAACETYLKALLSTIDDLRTRYPDRELALSLSGGRKGMSALTLFAAQQAGIGHLYHTLITDPDLEERIEEETSLESLDRLPTDDARAQRLFLEVYGQESIELFTIPLIPFAGRGS